MRLSVLAMAAGVWCGAIAGCQAGAGRAATDPEVDACQEWGGALDAGGTAMVELGTAASLQAPEPVGSLMRTFIAGVDVGQPDPEDLRAVQLRCAEIGVDFTTSM